MKFTEELLQAVHELDLKTRRNVSALLTGNIRSSFRGSGMQFKEFRQYEPGDDIRHMSWSVTARTGKATVKVYEEERELNVVLLVDVSGSSLFQYSRQRKIDMYAELGALIGLAAAKSGDTFAMMLFSNGPGQFIPFSKTRNHILSSLARLYDQPLEGQKSDIRPSLEYLSGMLKQRALIFVVSDFVMPDFESEMMRLSTRHEIVMLRCYDDAERGFAIRGVFEVRDPETGEFLLLDANSKDTRRALADYHTQLHHRLEKIAQSTKADYLPLSIEDDYLQRLVQFFRQRGPSRT